MIAIFGRGEGDQREIKTERVGAREDAAVFAVDGWTSDGFGSENDLLQVRLGDLHDLFKGRKPGTTHAARDGNANAIHGHVFGHMKGRG